MANDDLDAFLRRGTNYHGGAPEYFEDTHDIYGNYTGGQSAQQQSFFTPYTVQPPVKPQPPLYTQAPQSPYTAPKPQPQYSPVDNTEREISSPSKFQYYNVPAPEKAKSAPLPKVDQYISPRLYQNIVLYSPSTATDVERLIDFLRRREPAIVDLDPIAEKPDAQRVLDFTSGAVYALGGRIIAIKSNTFLIVPEGIDVAKPEHGDM